MRVMFHRDYDHRWPSRAITAFKAGYEGTVHRDAGAAAVAKGAATEVSRPARDAADVTEANGRADSVGDGDHRPAVPRRAGGAGGRLRRNGDADGRAGSSDQPVGDAQ